jgi:hypothetical protein
MKTKPPKSAASTKVVVSNEDKPAYDPLLYTKKWNNGHKFFLASEAKALTELLRTETNCMENFHTQKIGMVRPRNPLNGDITPRDARGEIVLNPNAHGKVANGIPLFSGRIISSSEIVTKFVQKGTVGKIGVTDSKYDILGNKGAFGGNISSQPENLFSLAKTQNSLKLTQQEERAEINNYIAREKAKRHEKELTKQLTTLRQQAVAKERELEYLQNTYAGSR